MRKALIAGALAAGTFLGSIGVAGAAQPANAGCFGQARSADASGTYNPSTGYSGNIGDFFSARKGDNSSMNIDYMNSVCGANIPATPHS